MIHQYPLELKDVAPGEGFTRIEAKRADGLPEGVHAGPFISADKSRVWKPLDVMPNPASRFRVPSREVECLQLMAGDAGFPVNWRIETAGQVEVDGKTFKREWLVRDFAWLIKAIDDPVYLTLNQVTAIEGGVRLLNSRGWEINDLITVALDRNHDLFIVDLSSAWPSGKGTHWDEEHRIYTWFNQIGCERLTKLRKDGRAAVGPLEWPHYDTARNVYASRNRPMSPMWARINGAHYIDANYRDTGVWTWIVTPELLSKETVDRYELTWAWSPIIKQE